MIKGVHAMFYSSEPDALRAFIRDKLGFAFADVGGGWLIFSLAEADLGCHPTEGKPPSGTHHVSFYCDDLDKTVAELRGRGVEFTDEIAQQSYGKTIHFTMPGDVRVELYQPSYTKAAPKPADSRATLPGSG